MVLECLEVCCWRSSCSFNAHSSFYTTPDSRKLMLEAMLLVFRTPLDSYLISWKLNDHSVSRLLRTDEGILLTVASVNRICSWRFQIINALCFHMPLFLAETLNRKKGERQPSIYTMLMSNSMLLHCPGNIRSLTHSASCSNSVDRNYKSTLHVFRPNLALFSPHPNRRPVPKKGRNLSPSANE